MKTLLINSNRFKQPWPVIPFGLGCVAAAVEQAGHRVKVLDLCFSGSPRRDIRRTLKEFEPDVIGISIRNIDNGTGYNTEFLLEDVRRDVVEPSKEYFAGPIVIGGPSVGVNGAEMLEYLDLQYAIRGDGEAAMPEFLSRLESGRPLQGMGGLVRRVHGCIVDDNAPMLVCDLDQLPMDRVYDHINLTTYRRFGSQIQVQTKRGCALSCSYCTYNAIEGRRWRLRDPQKVADDIEQLVRKTGINSIEFTDSTFNMPLEHCKAVLRAIEAKKLNLRLRTMGLNPGAVDAELVDLMGRVGFREVDLGAESACDVTLSRLGKCFRKDHVLKAARLLSDKKIAIMWYLLVGGPGENEATLRETFDTVNKAAMPWDMVNIGIGLRVYRGSPIARQMIAENPGCTDDNFLRPVSYEAAGLGVSRLKVLVKREALRRTNYFMYDEDENIPPVVQMLGRLLLKAFAPGQPIWRLFIVIRWIQRLTGINALRRAAFALASVEGPFAGTTFTSDRVGRIMVGSVFILATALGYLVNPLWLLLLGVGGAINVLQSGITEWCMMEKIVRRLGFPSERELGIREARQGLEKTSRMARVPQMEVATPDLAPGKEAVGSLSQGPWEEESHVVGMGQAALN